MVLIYDFSCIIAISRYTLLQVFAFFLFHFPDIHAVRCPRMDELLHSWIPVQSSIFVDAGIAFLLPLQSQQSDPLHVVYGCPCHHIMSSISFMKFSILPSSSQIFFFCSSLLIPSANALHNFQISSAKLRSYPVMLLLGAAYILPFVMILSSLTNQSCPPLRLKSFHSLRSAC